MALNRRPSLLAGYHNHFSSPDRFVIYIIINNISLYFLYRASLAPYYLSLAPVSMGPHVDEHSKRSRFPATNSQLSPLSVEVKKVCY
jgi:hypothetical protein